MEVHGTALRNRAVASLRRTPIDCAPLPPSGKAHNPGGGGGHLAPEEAQRLLHTSGGTQFFIKKSPVQQQLPLLVVIEPPSCIIERIDHLIVQPLEERILVGKQLVCRGERAD